MTWAELFAETADSDVTIDNVREALVSRRETDRTGDSERDD